MNDWLVVFKDGESMVVNNKDLVVNVCDYIITNTTYDIDEVASITLLLKA